MGEVEVGDNWVVLVPLLPNEKLDTAQSEITICGDKEYPLQDIAGMIKTLEKNLPGQITKLVDLPSHNILEPEPEIAIVRDQKLHCFPFPRHIPTVLKEIIKDALCLEAATNAKFDHCEMTVDFRFEKRGEETNRKPRFHSDYPAVYTTSSMYVVSGIPTTLGSKIPTAIGLSAADAIKKGFPIFSILPERMYHWTERFVHSKPGNRWKQGRKHHTRPYIFISFGYDKIAAPG